MARLVPDPGDPIGTPPTPTPSPTPTPTPSPTPTPTPTPAPSPGQPSLPAPPLPLPPLPLPKLPAPPAPVGTARWSAEDYAGVMRALLPRGLVWPDDPDGVQNAVLLGLAQVVERLDADASVLIDGALPGSTQSALLPEWEATLGLPDPCAGLSPTFAQRRDQVIARFVGAGGQSRQRFLDFAATLGFEIEIVNYTAFKMGLTPFGDQPLADDSVVFMWGVRVLSNPGGAATDVLICEFEAIKPAETSIILLT